jgi:hypothetical protein
VVPADLQAKVKKTEDAILAKKITFETCTEGGKATRCVKGAVEVWLKPVTNETKGRSEFKNLLKVGGKSISVGSLKARYLLTASLAPSVLSIPGGVSV